MNALRAPSRRILFFKSERLSQTMRQKIGRVGDEKREKMPGSVFLKPSERKYPVKVKRGDRYVYSPKLLLAAAREARMQGEEALASRAGSIRARLGRGGQ